MQCQCPKKTSHKHENIKSALSPIGDLQYNNVKLSQVNHNITHKHTTTYNKLCMKKSTAINNKQFPRGFSLVYLHYNDWPCSPSNYILQTSNFFCMLVIPIRTWDPRQFQIGGFFILRPEAGEYVFISLIANQVLEDEQRICT